MVIAAALAQPAPPPTIGPRIHAKPPRYQHAGALDLQLVR
jgi:hypothetical protein